MQRNRLTTGTIELLLLAGLLGAFAPRAAGVVATGGTVTNYTDANGKIWTAHIFTTNNVATGDTNLVVTFGGTVDYLVIGGGGGGGATDNSVYAGAGGGAGQVKEGSIAVSAPSPRRGRAPSRSAPAAPAPPLSTRPGSTGTPAHSLLAAPRSRLSVGAGARALIQLLRRVPSPPLAVAGPTPATRGPPASAALLEDRAEVLLKLAVAVVVPPVSAAMQARAAAAPVAPVTPPRKSLAPRPSSTPRAAAAGCEAGIQQLLERVAAAAPAAVAAAALPALKRKTGTHTAAAAVAPPPPGPTAAAATAARAS